MHQVDMSMVTTSVPSVTAIHSGTMSTQQGGPCSTRVQVCILTTQEQHLISPHFSAVKTSNPRFVYEKEGRKDRQKVL